MPLRLLVVEDEPDSAAVVKLILNPAQIQTVVAENGEAAWTLLQSDSDFSGAIIDLALPGMDGFGLMNAIRSTPALAHLKLVAVTAFHTPELKSQAIKAGFNAYFSKPLDTMTFLGALERVFAS
jgi:CheY-like chemotaxis protein